MSEIPEDIKKIAEALFDPYVALYDGPSEYDVAELILAERERATKVENDRCRAIWDIEELEDALLAERKNATMVERERCLAICKEQADKLALLNADRYWQTKRIEGAIRAGEEAGK